MRAERVNRFILRAGCPTLVFPFLDYGNAAALDRTSKTPFGLNFVALKGFSIDLVDKGYVAKLMVLGRKVSDHVLDGRQEGGAPFAQIRNRRGGKHLLRSGLGFGKEFLRG